MSQAQIIKICLGRPLKKINPMQEQDDNYQEMVNKHRKLMNPFQTLCDTCNALNEFFDQNPLVDKYEAVEQVYAQQSKLIKQKMKNLMEGLTDYDQNAKNLLDQAQNLINPDAE